VFERFGDQARDVVSLATAEARQLGHGHIGTKHLLLGILAEATSPAATALADSGTTLSGCRELAAELVGNRGGPFSRSGELPYTERANRSLERASRLALRRLDPQVDPSHILLSVLDVEGRAGQVLRGLSVDPATVRRHLEAVNVGGSAPQEADSPGPAGGSREVRGPDPACASCGASLSAHLAHRGLVLRGGRHDGSIRDRLLLVLRGGGRRQPNLIGPTRQALFGWGLRLSPLPSSAKGRRAKHPPTRNADMLLAPAGVLA
jgi:ATP-dependent Clp protease ATP-binding subunit ClpA